MFNESKYSEFSEWINISLIKYMHIQNNIENLIKKTSIIKPTTFYTSINKNSFIFYIKNPDKSETLQIK